MQFSIHVEGCRQLQTGHLYAARAVHQAASKRRLAQKRQAGRNSAGLLGASARDGWPLAQLMETELVQRAAAVKQACHCLSSWSVYQHRNLYILQHNDTDLLITTSTAALQGHPYRNSPGQMVLLSETAGDSCKIDMCRCYCMVAAACPSVSTAVAARANVMPSKELVRQLLATVR